MVLSDEFYYQQDKQRTFNLMLPLTISVGHKVDKTIETSICDFRYTASTATYGLDGCCCKVLVRTGNIGLQLKGNEQR